MRVELVKSSGRHVAFPPPVVAFGGRQSVRIKALSNAKLMYSGATVLSAVIVCIGAISSVLNVPIVAAEAAK